MKLLGVVGVMVLASTSWAGVPEWTIEPPAGWVEDTSAVEGMQEQMTAAQGIEQAVVKAWGPPDGSPGALVLQWVVASRGGTSARRFIEHFDRGVVRGAAKSAGKVVKQVDQPVQTVGNMVFAESVLELAEGRIRLVRRYQAATDGVHALIMMCAGDEAMACSRAVDGAQLVVPNAVALDRDRDPAYIAGYVAGLVVVCLLAAWLVLRLVSWLRR